MGKVLYLPETLTLKCSIAFPDETMRKAFTNAVDNHILHDVTYTLQGNTVYLTW